MFRKYGLPLLALIGAGFALSVALRGARPVPPAAPVAEPPRAPFHAFVAGAGLVETSTENISIGTQLPGIVAKIWVEIGSHVKAGDPLFTIDDRAQRALVAVKTAAVQFAEAQVADTANELKIAEGLHAKSAVSAEERDLRRYAARRSEAQLSQARADLEAANTDLDRLTVRAPVDGQVIQLKLHPGEFAPTGVLATPLLLLGGVEPLHVRVDVDENEASRVQAGAKAVGFVRGNKQIQTPLRFVRFEPYVVPKASLTGDSTERVDTRVLQVIYSFDRGDLPIYIGQQMDIYIDAPEHPAPDRPVD